ncbi:MAG: pyridine nucleotide-disulfide oxidoreductase/dicluster-binding protein [Anaerolineaceae bacterium]
MDQTRLRELEDQCIQECASPCVAYCPVHVDVRALTSAIATGDFQAAFKAFYKTIPFPEIIARTCYQPCQSACYRKTIGGDILIASLELASIQHSDHIIPKPVLLPKKDARVLIIGGGLSSLTAAFELIKKGYQVALYERENRLGGRLWRYPEDQLPAEVIQREIERIIDLGVDVHYNTELTPASVAAHQFDACYLGTGDGASNPFNLLRNPDQTLQVNPVTFQTSQTNVFAGGSLLHAPSTIFSVSDGRRAAISIDRFLQNVSLTASRVNEGAYDTRLITNISRVNRVEMIPPAKSGYSVADAIAEAKRCLQCDCMECVKVCEYLKHYGSYPRKYVREIYNNLSIIMRARTANKMINSCTLCGLCEEVCPTDLNMGVVNHEVRQTMVKTGKMPPSAHDFALRDMAFSNDLRVALTLAPDNSGTCDFLFFPGCQLTASNPEYIPKLYQSLSSALPNLGVMLRCCGAPADWSGEQELFAKTMDDFKTQWLTLGKPKLVLACTSCLRMFSTTLPEVETLSAWQVFEGHKLFPASRQYSHPLAIHDPCTSRHMDAWQDAVRTGLDAMGIAYHELEMSRDLTECCGYGGVTWLANPELVQDILKRRAAEDGADYLTYCVMCRDLLVGQGKPTLHLLDLIYGENLEQLAHRKGPDYSQRHENRLRAKEKMIKLITGKEHPMTESYESYTLQLTPEIRAALEDRLILFEDVQKVIEHADTTGECFKNQQTGHTLAFFKPNLITYWVEYTHEGDAWVVHNAYSHRMDLEGASS